MSRKATNKRVVMMAAGTGGHVIPAVTIAQELQKHGIEVHWVGTKQGIEAKLIPSDIPLYCLNIRGIRGKAWYKILLTPFRLLYSFIQALSILRRVKPHMVVGMGGYVCVPGGVAAWLLRRPFVIHEQNAIPGSANKYLSYLAKTVFTAFPITLSSEKLNKKMKCIGNPVREVLCALPSPTVRYGKREGRLHVLILGGSQGAFFLNTLVPAALSCLTPEERPETIHQSGDKFYQNTQHCYQQHDIKANVIAFIDDIASAYAWADLVICRAGALTVSEIRQIGVAAIFVPYPHATDNHQLANAQWLAKDGGAFIFSEKNLTPVFLAQQLRQTSRESLLQIAMTVHHPVVFAASNFVRHCLRFVYDP